MRVLVCDKCKEQVGEFEEFVELSSVRAKGMPGNTQVIGNRVEQFHVQCAPCDPPREDEFVPGSVPPPQG